MTILRTMGLRLARALAGAAKFLLRARLGLFVLFTVLCLRIGEHYPFSDFPMYSRLGDWDYLLYIADENDRPIPLNTAYGMRTSILKKFFHSEAREIAQQYGERMRNVPPQVYAPAGELSIDRILSFRGDLDQSAHPWREIRLYFLDLRMQDDKLVRRHTLIATRLL